MTFVVKHVSLIAAAAAGVRPAGKSYTRHGCSPDAEGQKASFSMAAAFRVTFGPLGGPVYLSSM